MGGCSRGGGLASLIFATAGRAFLDAGLPWEAAVSFSKGNDEARCFDALVSVDVANVRYRSACRHAIHLASRFHRLPDRLLVLVGSFVSALPEIDAVARKLDEKSARSARATVSTYGLLGSPDSRCPLTSKAFVFAALTP